MYFISSTELTNPTIDINPTSLQGVAKRIIWQQQCRVYVNCRVCQFCRAYEVHSQHLVSVLFIVMYSSLHHSFIWKKCFYSHHLYNNVLDMRMYIRTMSHYVIVVGIEKEKKLH